MPVNAVNVKTQTQTQATSNTTASTQQPASQPKTSNTLQSSLQKDTFQPASSTVKYGGGGGVPAGGGDGTQQTTAKDKEVAGAAARGSGAQEVAGAAARGSGAQEVAGAARGAGLAGGETGGVKGATKVTGTPYTTEAAADGQLVDKNGNIVNPNTPLSRVDGATPKGGTTNNQTVLYVNGILTDVPAQKATMQNMADKTGSKVVGLHNATTGDALKDSWQTAGDKIDQGENKAAQNMTNIMYNELKSGQDVHVMAHSQGAAVTARSLRDLEQRLLQENGGDQARTKEQLSHIKVDTFGGAGRRYPNGPSYDHYVNQKDPVPMALGQNTPLAGPGEGARVHSFSDGSNNPQDYFAVNHNVDTMYLKHYPM